MRRILAVLLLGAALFASTAMAQSQPAPAPAPTANAAARPRVILVRVWTTDLDRSEHFYREVFGFSAAQAFGPGNRMFGAPSLTATSIVLAHVDQPRANGSFALAVDDTAAVMNAVEAAGGHVEHPAQQAHGMPIGFVTDPDGTTIEVIQIPQQH